MKISDLPARSGQIKSVFQLETPAERALSDAQLITMTDNCRGFTDNPPGDGYRLNGKPLGEPRHMGGDVNRNGDRVSVTVFMPDGRWHE